MSVLTFARRDECWKKGKNPFKNDESAIGLICDKCGNVIEINGLMSLLNFLIPVKKKLKGGLKNGNRK